MKKMSIFLGVIFVALFGAVMYAQAYICGDEMAVSGNFYGEGRIKGDQSDVYCPAGEIRMKVTDGVIILKNGRVCEYELNGEEMIFAVNDGDIFHGDARSVTDGVIYVSMAGENVTTPETGTKIRLAGGVVKLFEVCVFRGNKKD